ncbi:polyprenyl synthetase family protein [Alphaproteobacteria bacterium]|nr:polyprenyl synthetase family protein [Alphaproteobacteria bacterium]
MKINTLINKERKNFDNYFVKLLKSTLSKEELSKAMYYGSMNGGKRIRPFIVSIFAKLANVKKKHYMRLSAAIECIHSYSLIHDDLPSMDNDDFRRGKLSTHKKFNEATAILAGDALHDLAFEILANKKTHKDAEVRIQLIEKLSKILGFQGLAGGQSFDLLFAKTRIKKKEILKMYKLKTAALFSFCCSSVFILGGRNKKEINFAEEFGEIYGLMFQIIDDILDETKDFKFLGKTPGKDKKQGKSTLISVIGEKKAIKFCLDLIKQFEYKNKKYLKQYKILNEVLSFNLNNYK